MLFYVDVKLMNVNIIRTSASDSIVEIYYLEGLIRLNLGWLSESSKDQIDADKQCHPSEDLHSVALRNLIQTYHSTANKLLDGWYKGT